MTYQVLARKWRPQDFSGVVGQKPIVTALSNALAEDRIAQAYLFSGIRGIGKTSAARIFAKALNCEQGPSASPCGDCPSCQEITAGTNVLDVIEVDAATYSKVEQIRELTESLKYGPARDRYKVVILDEIHRLSRQAFDALLKIVEEPPKHLVFIFATTEIESVPATILSRCQEFRFRRVAFEELSEHLEKIAAAEGIDVGPAALRLIARASDGSVRDAVALLDQLATFGSGKIEEDDAAGVLGGVDQKLFRDLLQAILGGDSSSVSETIRHVELEGWDPRYVFTEFLNYCRTALHLALGAGSESLDLPGEESEGLTKLATTSGYENLLRLLHLLLQSEEIVRRSESGILAVEIAWLRAAELPKLIAIEKLLHGQTPPGPAGKAQSKEATSPTSSARTSAAKGKPPPPAPTATASPAPSLAEAAPPASTAVSAPGDTDNFLEHVSRRNQALAAHLTGAPRLHYHDGELSICVTPGDTWIRDRLAVKKHRLTLEEALAATWGSDTRWRLVESEEPAATVEEAPQRESISDPRVQTVLDIFGGSVESVEDNE
ncbi:MAG: DNA polymerase III subunit gamma/tau [Acidobacteriota bacterium]|nr:DNA polymerase III subunit gamma/tau [Acidobacteriota bacterium]